MPIDFEEEYPQLYDILSCFNLTEDESFINISYKECLEKLKEKYNLYYEQFEEFTPNEYFEENEIHVYFPLDDNWTEFLLRDY